MPVESEWNIALDTMFRISTGLHRCNDGMHAGDFLMWLKGIYHLYGELSTWMTSEEIQETEKLLATAKQYKQFDFETNLNQFFLTTLYLRKVAHRNRLLLKEAEDTFRHGGAA